MLKRNNCCGIINCMKKKAKTTSNAPEHGLEFNEEALLEAKAAAQEAAGDLPVESEPEIEEPDEEPEEPQKERPEHNFDLAMMMYSIPVLLAAGFAAFAFYSKHSSLPELIAAAVSVVFFGFLILRTIPELIGFFAKQEEQSPVELLGERSQKRAHPLLKIIFFSVLYQIAAILLVYTANNPVNGMQGSFTECYSALFVAPAGKLFSGCVPTVISKLGAISALIPQNYTELVSGPFLIAFFAANTLIVAVSCAMLYELVICDADKRSALFAVTLMLVSPTVILLLQPLSGTAYFFLLTLTSLLCCRRGRFVFAGIFAAAACIFNIFAALIAIVILMEGIRAFANAKRAEGSGGHAGILVGSVFGAMIPALSAGGAVAVWQLMGRGLTAFDGDVRVAFEPLGRLISDWLAGGRQAAGLVPLIALLFFAVVLLLSVPKERCSYSIFGILYLALAPSLTDSAMTVFFVFAYPLLPLVFSAFFRRRFMRAVILAATLALTVLSVVYLYVR